MALEFIARNGIIALNNTIVSGSLTVTGGITGSADARFNGVTVGRGSGSLDTNTAVGSLALGKNTTGNQNVAIGSGSLGANTTGASHTAVGYDSLKGV